MWVELALLSALLLGLYDVAKKWSVQKNAVLPVLFYASVAGFLAVLPLVFLSFVFPESMESIGLRVGLLTFREHVLVFAKALLVATSWICVYFAMKHLPISIVSPIRSSAPVWTVLGAVVLFAERLSSFQWLGIGVTFGAYYVFSVIGKAEDIRFQNNRFVLLAFVATITGAMSSLYDKALLQRVQIPPGTLQVWFSLYLVVVFGAVMFFFRKAIRRGTPFAWRWSIPLIGVLLIAADMLYFRALATDGALVSVVSVVRRSSVVVAFLLGGVLFKEKFKRWKAIPLTGVLAGVILMLFRG